MLNQQLKFGFVVESVLRYSGILSQKVGRFYLGERNFS